MNVHTRPPASPGISEGDSITARLAVHYVHPEPGTRHLNRFEQLRAVLRSDGMRQGGAANSPTEKEDPTRASIFFLYGEEHRRRRGAIISFFTPKAIATRHMPIIVETADRLIAGRAASRLPHWSLKPRVR